MNDPRTGFCECCGRTVPPGIPICDDCYADQAVYDDDREAELLDPPLCEMDQWDTMSRGALYR